MKKVSGRQYYLYTMAMTSVEEHDYILSQCVPTCMIAIYLRTCTALNTEHFYNISVMVCVKLMSHRT